MKYIGGTKLDERIIRTDLDPGFQENRQYGWVDLVEIKFLGASITYNFITAGGSLAVRFETSTATSTIQDEEATAVQSPMSVKRRKMSTAKEGSVGLRDTAGGWSKLSLITASVVTCIKTSGISTISTIVRALPSRVS